MSLTERPGAVLSAALVVFAALCIAMPSVWHGDAKISDVPVYQRYGDAMERGSVPYRGFRPEYPPGALAAFVVPSLASTGAVGYARAFGVELALLGAACVVFTFLSLRSLGATGGRLVAGVALPAAAPLLLGPLVLTRFDLYPAALVAAALAAFVAGRDRLGGGVLGAAVAVKLFPAVLIPLAVAWTWRRRGRREALVVLAICAGVAAAIFLPFVAIAPDGVGWSLWRQVGRPLQIESFGAAILLALHQFGMPLGWGSSHGSQNLTGTTAAVASVVTSVAQAAALLWIWTRYARRAVTTSDAFVCACAAALVAFVALGKVLSPQFLIWLLVGVALVGARRTWPALALLVLACALTRGWFPDRYWHLVRAFDPLASWLVVARDAALLALLAVLVRPERERAR
ncbi:MAG: glycosyltransferase 87 family protein [Gaiellaceae bacterium]